MCQPLIEEKPLSSQHRQGTLGTVRTPRDNSKQRNIHEFCFMSQLLHILIFWPWTDSRKDIFFRWQRRGTNLEIWKYLITLRFSLQSKNELSAWVIRAHLRHTTEQNLGEDKSGWRPVHSFRKRVRNDTTLRTLWTVLSTFRDNALPTYVNGKKIF